MQASFLRYTVDVSLSQPLQVISDPDNVLGRQIGNGLWTSAQELAIFLCTRPTLGPGQSVLELGAGLGLVGQAMALHGAQVVVSDTEDMMQLLSMNIKANMAALHASSGSISQCVLAWGTSLSHHAHGPHNLHPDYIVGSDITYDESCYLPLLQTAAAYAWSNPHIRVILAMPDRQESAAFLEVTTAHGLTWRRLRHVHKPELLTPVSIYQFIFRPVMCPQLRQLISSRPNSSSHPTENSHTSTAVSTQSGYPTDSVQGHNVCPPSLPGGVPPSAAVAAQAHTSTGKAAQPVLLLVLDFDWSMIEENSDTFVVRDLGAWEAFERLREEKLPWTELMDKAMLAAYQERGATPADVRAACDKIPMHPDMKEVLKQAAANSAVHMVILSDANTVFIDNVLDAQGLQGCFESVITNPAEYCGGALRVRPYHTGLDQPAPHGCASCPPNLCKGLVLEDVLLQRNYQQVVYLGDGRGDYCPCTRLGPNDCILARQSYPDGSACALPKLLADQGASIKDSLQFPSSAGAEQKAIPGNGGLQGLSAVGAVQTAAAPTEDRMQRLLPAAAGQQHTAADSRCREQQQASKAEVDEQGAGSTQGSHTAKRHKRQSPDQSLGGGSCSDPLQQDKDKCEQPDSADIDRDKCQHIREASISGQAVCPEGLPPPPPMLSGSMGQHDVMQDYADTCVEEDDLSSMSHSQLQHAGHSSVCARVYTWADSAEAARMLHALVSGEHEPSQHNKKYH